MNELSVSAILVDDEPRGVTALQRLLEQNCPEVNILAACLDVPMAKDKIRLLKPQLVFLDISMPGKSGFDLLNELSPVTFEIIFITAHSEYVLNAFKYSAVDYLLKPVDENLLSDAVNRAIKRIYTAPAGSLIETLLHNLQKQHTPKEMKLCMPSLKGFEVINLTDIIYGEADNSYTTFYLANGQRIVSSKSISDYEELLQDSGFLRIHKSYLINLVHVKEYIRGEGGSVLLSNNSNVEVARRKKELFIARMKDLFKY